MYSDVLLDMNGLREALSPVTNFLNLHPQVTELLVLAAENEWCPIATLHSAGQLQKMSAWQIYNVFHGVLAQYFPLNVHSLAEGSGFAVIHQSNGNCVIGDGEGKVEMQIISPLDIGFINYLAGAKTKSKSVVPAVGFGWS